MREYATLAMVLLVGCGGSQERVERAQGASYDAEFAVVFQEAVTATKALYPQLQANPQQRMIKTAWHPMPIEGGDTPRGRGVEAANQLPAGGEGGEGLGRGTDVPNQGMPNAPGKRYFVRFDIMILGDGPWKVHVMGHASEWDRSAAPMPLDGAETPYWLEGRVEKLQVAIYERLKAHAVKTAPAQQPAAN